MAAALGGRAAEEVIFNEVSSGALNDLEKVTKQAYTMVAMYGLSEKLGNISYHDSTGEYSNSLQKPYSEETGKLIDEEVRRLVDQAYEEALRIIREHKEDLDRIAQTLIDKEVIFGEDLEKVLGKRPEQQRDNEEADLEKKAEANIKKAQQRKDQEEERSKDLPNNGQEGEEGSAGEREGEDAAAESRKDQKDEDEEEKGEEGRRSG
jgi:hypothetical protein